MENTIRAYYNKDGRKTIIDIGIRTCACMYYKGKVRQARAKLSKLFQATTEELANSKELQETRDDLISKITKESSNVAKIELFNSNEQLFVTYVA
jgi:hypothetical protein